MSIKGKKILALFAHPDDETFGPGGSFAKWVREGAEIHLVTATKGQSGKNSLGNGEIGKIRAQELLSSAKVLGISSVEFLDFFDGQISNNDLQKLEEIFTEKIKLIQPDILLTYDLNGISGHLDHIAVASAASQSFTKTKLVPELYYFVILKKYQSKEPYFIFRPDGRDEKEIDLVVDTENVWDQKVEAMHKHKSQFHDVESILKRLENLPKREYFVIKRLGDE
jgi:N-acetylglucosamine malate deacetylase 2